MQTSSFDENQLQLQLPLEQDSLSAISNLLARSALFTCRVNQGIVYVEEQPLACQDGNSITYTGKLLNQVDQDIWLIIKSAFSETGLAEMDFEAKTILKALGKTHGKTDREWLKRKLKGLRSALFSFETNDGGTGKMANLLADLNWIDDTNKFRITLDPKIQLLFSTGMYSMIDMDVRISIKSHIAKYLHTYWSTEKRIAPLGVKTLYKLVNVKGDIHNFKRSLKTALDELAEIGFIKESWEIVNDVIMAKRA